MTHVHVHALATRWVGRGRTAVARAARRGAGARWGFLDFGWVHTWEAAHSSLLTYTSTSAASALLLRPKRSCARPQRWVRPA